jgi:thioredoxin 1
MPTVHGTKENFKDLVEKNPIVIVDFWAEWCGPCKRFAPVFEAAAEKHTDVTFVKIDTEDQPELAGAFGIRAIPTLMVFRDQIALFEQAGALPATALEELITQVRALDMDEVRKKLDEAEAAGEA